MSVQSRRMTLLGMTAIAAVAVVFFGYRSNDSRQRHDSHEIHMGRVWPVKVAIDEGIVLVSSHGQPLRREISLRNTLQLPQPIEITGKSCGCIATSLPTSLPAATSETLMLETTLPMASSLKRLVVDIASGNDPDKRASILWTIDARTRVRVVTPPLDTRLEPDGFVTVAFDFETLRWTHEPECVPQIKSSFSPLVANVTVLSRITVGRLNQTRWKCDLRLNCSSNNSGYRQVRQLIPISISDDRGAITTTFTVWFKPAFREIPQSVLLRSDAGGNAQRVVRVVLSPSVQSAEAVPQSGFLRVLSQYYDPHQQSLKINLAASTADLPSGISRSSVRVIPDGDISQSCEFDVLVWKAGARVLSSTDNSNGEQDDE